MRAGGRARICSASGNVSAGGWIFQMMRRDRISRNVKVGLSMVAAVFANAFGLICHFEYVY